MKIQQEKTEKYGVENIKKTYRFAGNLTEGVVTIAQDPDLDTIIGAGSNLVLKSIGDIPNLKHIPREYIDMSDEEQQEVKEDFAKHFDIPNDKVEAVFEDAQAWINATAKLGFSLIDARKG